MTATNSALENLKNRWQTAQSWEKGLALGFLACLVAALIAWQVLPGTDNGDMVPLFTDLTPTDAGDIKMHLDEEGIPHRVGAKNTIFVRPGDVYDLRLRMAAQGMPTGGVVGFEIMDSIPMGATDFDRHVSYIRGLQGELARTIESFAEVNRARVHIVLPQESVFVARSAPATAAIVLELAPMAQLKPEAVQGVMNLVAAGVEGLDSDNVTVVDTSGIVLSQRVTEPGGASGVAQSNLALQMEVQDGLRDRLSSLLEQVLGPGNVVVQVSADLNFDSREIHQEIFQPINGDRGLVTSLQQVEEHFTGTSGVPDDIPAGADANVPSYPAYGGTGDSTYERTETTENSVVNRMTEHHTVAPGTVERLSVAVVVNDHLTGPEEEMLSTVVASALGFDGNREDQISIAGVPFDTSLADRLGESMETEAPAAVPQPAEIPLAYYIAGGALLALLAGLLLGGILRRRQREDEYILHNGEPSGDWAFPEGQMRDGTDERKRALLQAIGNGGDGLQGTAKQMAEENPGRVAELVRTWLAEDAGGGRGR